ncbi:hypothetical protein DAH55_03825 [Sphingomonas koreensis]|uniref:hypothetical protein n=1 Tax=Sphingomonas koreensis TaxID=93064 RepID=UPI000835EBCA|nr:hypothetical protein [Sphingomonas koreensis]PJI89068.1 hypothetical protein BDW16_2374 [Sphingomonas koreensis]RSU63351.1 hypothetical protein DAH56_00280 [Sphingomonas koreensis]RSU71016.1 hypothetical protein DAH55_03825 [Sphingomonas koreensis]
MKISTLQQTSPAAPLTGEESLPLVQAGVTVGGTANQVAALVGALVVDLAAAGGIHAFYGTRADADDAIADIPDGAFVQVFADEDEDGARTAYRKVAGVLQLAFNFSSLSGLVATPAGAALVGEAEGGSVQDILDDFKALELPVDGDGYIRPGRRFRMGSADNFSTDARFIISENVTATPLGSPHFFATSNRFAWDAADLSVATYDVRDVLALAVRLIHFAGYQFGPTKTGAGVAEDLWAFCSSVTVNAGEVKRNTALKFLPPTIGGTAKVLQNLVVSSSYLPEYSDPLNPTTDTTNYFGHFLGEARITSDGQARFGKLLIAQTEGTAQKLAHILAPGGSEAILRLQQDGHQTVDIVNPAGQIYAVFRMASVDRLKLHNAGHLEPCGAGQNLGSASFPWESGWVTNPWTETSDAREKHWIGFPQGEDGERHIRAARRLAADLGFFQWLSAIEAKAGDDDAFGARWHFGIRAQRAAEILFDEGIEQRPAPGADPRIRTAWLTYDRWDDEYEAVVAPVRDTEDREVMTRSPILGLDGQPITRRELRKVTIERERSLLKPSDKRNMRRAEKAGRAVLKRAAGDRWGVRPSQMALYIVAGLAAEGRRVQSDARRLDDIERRLAALETDR